MLTRIVKKELLDTFSSVRFLVIFAACSVLVLLGIFTGARNYQNTLDHYQAAQSVMRDTVEQQVNYQALGVWGNYKLYKRPPQLSAFVQGIEGELGRSATMSIYDEPVLYDTRFNEEPVYAIFGTLDLGFIVNVVLSLFAILLTFDAISGEKERGTLKLMLSNAVPRDSLILGKLVGAFLSLVLPLSVPLLLGVLAVSLMPQIELGSSDWLRLFTILGLMLTYLTVFLALGLFVSSRTRRSSTSFLMLLVIWVLFVWVVPKGAVMAAAEISPVPSGAEIEAMRGEVQRQSYREIYAELDRWRRQNPDAESVPQEIRDAITASISEQADLAQRRIDEAYSSAQRRRLGLATWMSRLSPSGAFSLASVSLAQTGISRQDRFLSSVKEYRRQFQDYIRVKTREEQQAGNQWQPREEGARLDISEMPAFQFRDASYAESIAESWIDIALLMVLAFLLFSGAFVSFLRYDVR